MTACVYVRIMYVSIAVYSDVSEISSFCLAHVNEFLSGMQFVLYTHDQRSSVMLVHQHTCHLTISVTLL